MLRRPVIQLVLLTLVALGQLAAAADFFRRANTCWAMRLPAAERPPCCNFAGLDRITPPEGDCCKTLLLDESADLLEVASFEMLAAPSLPSAHLWSSQHGDQRIDTTMSAPPSARAPPWLDVPTRTIVLRL